MTVEHVSQQIAQEQGRISQLKKELSGVLVGQTAFVDRLLLGILCDGHILVEGLPGLAKTTAVKALAQCVQASFARIQFTPDLLPADVIGTLIYNQQIGGFSVKKGPIFANIVLADEINRAPAKVQSALLEAMQERQVTLGAETFPLDEPFMVMATQNPVEQQGTYPLPEAQLDRFMLKIKVDYPTFSEELEIMERSLNSQNPNCSQVWTKQDLIHLKSLISSIYIDDKVKNYILKIVASTRNPAQYKMPQLKDHIEVGASPRASIFLAKAAKGHAALQGRGFVTPFDVKQIAADILRHRIILSYEAQAENIETDNIIKEILERTDVP